MSFSFIAGCFVVLLVIVVLIPRVVADNKREKAADSLARVPDFETHHSFFSGFGGGIAIDEKRQKLCLLSQDRPPRVVGFNAVVSAELIEDGVTVQRTDRGSQLAGAAVGTALLGVPGLLLGGLSAGSTSKPKITRCEIRLIIDDLSCPTHALTFFACAQPFDRNGAMIVEVLKDAAHWHGLLQVVIRRGATAINSVR